MPEQTATFNTWAIVEVMGHKKFAGFVTEQSFGAAALIRVDVPETHQPERRNWQGVKPARTTAAYSKLIGVGSIYMVTPCTEEVARKVATVIESDNDPIPVAIPEERRLAAPAPDGDDVEDVEDLDDFEVSVVGRDDDDDDDDEDPFLG